VRQDQALHARVMPATRVVAGIRRAASTPDTAAFAGR
jgi:hypothetical protein